MLRFGSDRDIAVLPHAASHLVSGVLCRYAPCQTLVQLNFAGVLKFKKQSEQLLQQSGLPWVLLRPGRLTDGPYTSFDLNTLLRATSGARQAVQVSSRVLGE